MGCGCSDKHQRRMRNRVTVQKKDPNATAEASGHVDWSNDSNWIPVGNFRCHIITRGGRERWRFNQVEPTVERMIEFRSNKTTRLFTPEYRCKFKQDDRTLVWEFVAAFDRDADRQYVEVHCTSAN